MYTKRPYKFQSSFNKYLNSSPVLGLSWAMRYSSRWNVSPPEAYVLYLGDVVSRYSGVPCSASRDDQCCGEGRSRQRGAGTAVGLWVCGCRYSCPRPRPLNAPTPPSRPLFPDLQFLLFLLDHTFPSAIAYKSCSPGTFACPLMSLPFQSGTWVWIPALVWPLQSCPWECSGCVLVAASSCYRFRCSQQPCGHLLGTQLLHGRVGWCSCCCFSSACYAPCGLKEGLLLALRVLHEKTARASWWPFPFTSAFWLCSRIDNSDCRWSGLINE